MLQDHQATHGETDTTLSTTQLQYDRATIYYLIGDSLLSASRVSEAIAWYERSLLLYPCMHQAHYRYTVSITQFFIIANILISSLII